MFNFFKKIKIVAHDGSFHADDVFACAALSILLEKQGRKFEIIRTRDKHIIESAHFVVDVGGIYDPEKNRFDHHQIEGAGKRVNGIPYASCGLVWKKYGVELCGSQQVADRIDNLIFAAIDGSDNGVEMMKPIFENVFAYHLSAIVASYNLTWKEDDAMLRVQFEKAVDFAKFILKRKIQTTKDEFEAEDIVKKAYEASADKKIVVMDQAMTRWVIVNQLGNFEEPIFVVFPDRDDKAWRIACVPKVIYTFNYKKLLPKSWAALAGEELAKVSGVADAVFCHRDLFLAVAKSKEGAIKMAQLALENLEN